MSNQGVAAQSLVTFRNSQGTEARGTLLKLTRSTVVFEVYNPYSVVQLSEVLQELTIRRKDKFAYRGKAVVSNLVNTGLMLVVSVTLVDPWQVIPESLQTPGAARVETEEFISEWKKTHDIRPGFRLIVGEIRSFLSEFSRWLEPVNPEVDERNTGISEEMFLEIATPSISAIQAMFSAFEDEAQAVPTEAIEIHQAFVRRDLHPLILRAPFVHRAYSKPLGYAGDYEMVNMMLRDAHEGPTTYAQIIHAVNLQLDVARAHRNRIDLIYRSLVDVAKVAASQERPANVLNIGCGPAEEVFRFITNTPLSNRCQFRLLDFSDETIDFTKKKLSKAISESHRLTNIEYTHQSVHSLLKQSTKKADPAELEKYDIVYCAGLFDYLSDKVCSRLLKLFYAWTKPDGLVLVTNVHPSNPNRMALEYVLDWHLIYRNEHQMESLLPAMGVQRTYTDQTGVNVFLEVRKPDI